MWGLCGPRRLYIYAPRHQVTVVCRNIIVVVFCCWEKRGEGDLALEKLGSLVSNKSFSLETTIISGRDTSATETEKSPKPPFLRPYVEQQLFSPFCFFLSLSSSFGFRFFSFLYVACKKTSCWVLVLFPSSRPRFLLPGISVGLVHLTDATRRRRDFPPGKKQREVCFRISSLVRFVARLTFDIQV